MLRATLTLLVLIALAPAAAVADQTQKSQFASVYLKSDKIGQVHLTTIRNEQGEIEEMRANASVSFLGMEVYGFTQNLNETWTGGELQKMKGQTDDNGTTHEISLNRNAEDFQATYNGKDLTLPLNAFPTSPWHYNITDNTLLFNIVDFDLLKVKIAKVADTIKIGGKDVKTEKFTFTGDWEAKLWFDANKEFVKGEYDVSGRQVTVILD
ncbi:hypothetical protein J0X12_07030 [Sneathiella sp. CAU 1612]|uniref:DUF3108 domain-containing protein n=1 Tax=Sneathiella sedimenti TaxID=2816034 RepID=A0ABS3F4B6_9PROT|nr:DUF6134 family protein [Sneathiella sedimenti]MBO0333359.1 hypothetical protein [Sneathiella sedimenti]